MKTKRFPYVWLVALGSVGLLLVVSVVAGIGSYIGQQMAQKRAIELMPPIQLNAGTAARSKSISMATGLIDENVEGLFILDHVSGNLQCWVLSPRTGAVGGVYRANVAQDLGAVKGGQADYVMATGNFFFTGGVAGNNAPGQSVCYVADAGSGKVVGYGLVYDKQAIRRGAPQAGVLNAVCKGAIRGEQTTRDQ